MEPALITSRMNWDVILFMDGTVLAVKVSFTCEKDNFGRDSFPGQEKIFLKNPRLVLMLEERSLAKVGKNTKSCLDAVFNLCENSVRTAMS